VTLDHPSIDRLEEVTLALEHAHAHADWRAASAPAEDLPELGAEATRMRDTLAIDAAALAHHAIIDADRVEALRKGVGYRNVADDLCGLVALCRGSWPSIEGRSRSRPRSSIRRRTRAIGSSWRLASARRAPRVPTRPRRRARAPTRSS
jgi:hypothetical protein